MDTVFFKDIKDQIISNMQNKTLIPIIGSGFTKNCPSVKGRVPSGEDYRIYMIEKIHEVLPLSDSDIERLKADSFSSISSVYHKVVPISEQEQYLADNFTKVAIEENKQKLLSLSWAYIYTLNIDDGIENCSDYRCVIYSNRSVNERVFDRKKCVIKLHGDVNDMLSYLDSNSEIFTQEQYVHSLKNNDSLLSKLKHDSIYNNIMFIGCSLDDEIDLLYSLVQEEKQATKVAKYVCLTQEPSILDKIKYQKYGITHCVLFDSYDSIYNELYAIGLEAQKICADDLTHYKRYTVNKLSSDYEINRHYLLFGKSLIEKDHTLSLPYFFITREKSNVIIDNFTAHNLQVLVGSRCSGKTYILADLAGRIRDRDVFLFETKDRLSNQAFDRPRPYNGVKLKK